MFTYIPDSADSDLTSYITSNVMKCLLRSQFFQRLDDLLCPEGSANNRELCAGDYRLATTALQDTGFDSADLEDIFNVLKYAGRML